MYRIIPKTVYMYLPRTSEMHRPKLKINFGEKMEIIRKVKT